MQSRRNDDGVQIALNPDELDLDKDAIQRKYDQQMRDSQLQKEDLSDMVADHAAKQAKVRPISSSTVTAVISSMITHRCCLVPETEEAAAAGHQKRQEVQRVQILRHDLHFYEFFIIYSIFVSLRADMLTKIRFVT